MSSEKININVSGGYANLGNASQGDGNTLNSKMETIQTDNHLSDNEHIFKALDSLRQAIESDTTLSKIQRQAATSDLASFSEEVKKPSSEQNLETKKFFWERLTEVLKFSSALISVSVAVAKLTGLI